MGKSIKNPVPPARELVLRRLDANLRGLGSMGLTEGF